MVVRKNVRNTDVSGNIGGHITTLGLDNREGGQGSSAKFVVHLGGTLEETRVEIKDITGVSFATRRTTEKKRHLTVSDGLLGQIIIDDQG